jgi:hypothetical protein
MNDTGREATNRREPNMLLTTKDLIDRMTPTALAETIASIEQAENLDRAEQGTVDLLTEVLAANVGDDEADELIAAARRG